MDSSLQTLPQRLRARASETPDDIAYLRLSAQGEWLETRWCEVLEHVDALAANLLELGLRHGDRVVIMMPTSPLWEYCQLAILSVGGIVIGLDAHDAPRNIRHILELTQPRLVFTGSAEQLALISANWMRPEISIVASGLDANTPALDLDSLFKPCGKAVQCPAPAPDQIATIVFTSGSTGQPKGIEYSHRQVLAACDQILQRFPGIGPDARLACWLPLSNLFQRMINFCALSCGARSYFVDRPDQIAQLLPHIAPSFFIGVPRFFEKLHAGIVRTIATRPLPTRTLVGLAWTIGARAAAARRQGHAPDLLTRTLHPLADKILSQVRAAMGPNLQFMVSGSAPLPHWLAERFHGLGWLVLEAYGISENVMPVAINSPEHYRFGSVGHPLPGNELCIADDKELLIRGPGVFKGYYGDAADSSPIDAAGFLHTGDYARIDADGYVWLEGRKSEVFKTSTGRRIAPAPIEGALKQIPYVEHAIITGRDRPYPLAILALDTHHAACPDPSSAAGVAAIGADVTAACTEFADYQRPGAVVVTTQPFTIAGGELTANLKIRRKPVEERFAPQIDQAYSAPVAAAPRPGATHMPVIIAP